MDIMNAYRNLLKELKDSNLLAKYNVYEAIEDEIGFNIVMNSGDGLMILIRDTEYPFLSFTFLRKEFNFNLIDFSEKEEILKVIFNFLSGHYTYDTDIEGIPISIKWNENKLKKFNKMNNSITANKINCKGISWER